MLEKDKIILFLENLINDIKIDNISHEDMQQVTELYLFFKMKNTDGEYSEKEFIKFLSLGWYVYTEYLKKK